MKKIILFISLLLVSFVCVGCNNNANEIVGITISSNENLKTIAVGETLQLTAVVYPESASQEVVWSSESSSIASVSESGLVTGVAKGNTNIVATSKVNSNISKKFALIVEEAGAIVVDPVSINITSANGTTCKAGEKINLTAEVLPAEANQSVIWSTSDSSIATVSRGEVSTLKAGTVTITATSKELNTVFASIEITVEAVDAPIVSAEWAAMEFTTHEAYVTSDDDTKLKVKGVVTHINPISENTVSYFIQNGTEGYYVYAQDAILYPVELGKVYEVGGYKKYYRGLNEIVNVEYFVASTDAVTFDYIDLSGKNPSSLDDMKVYQGSYVSGKGLFVSGTVAEKAFNITVSVNGYNTTLRIDPSYSGAEEFAAICETLTGVVAGLEVEFKGFMTAFGYGTPANQIQITKASDLQIAQASASDVLNACLEELTITNNVGFNKNDIDLPSVVSGFENVTITWTSNSELINVATKAVTHGTEDVTVTLTATLTLNGTSITKDFAVLVSAMDNNVYEVVASLDLEDAAPANSYGCSETKPGYAEGNVTLGGHTWMLRNALIANSSSDKFEGTMGIRAKSGSSAEGTARIEILEAGEYNVVEFAAAVYGNHVLGTQIRVEYTDEDGSWVASDVIVTLNSHSLETFRITLPEGVKKVAIVVIENTGKTVNIDTIKLMK